MFVVGDRVQYFGGGRFEGARRFEGGVELKVGQIGVVHSVPGAHGDLGVTFRDESSSERMRVSVNVGDVRFPSAAGLLNRVVASGPSMAPCASQPALRAPRRPAEPMAPARSVRRAVGERPPALPPLRSRADPRQLGRTRSAPSIKLDDESGSPLSAASGTPMKRRPSRQMGRSRSRMEDLGRRFERELTFSSEAADAASASSQEKPHPPSFYCPISRQCMHDPVVLTDGHTYERKYIEQWLEGNCTSPVSGAVLPDKTLFPNHALRNAIEEYFEQVLAEHRQAVREVMTSLMVRQRNFSCSSTLMRTVDAMMQCSLLVNADLSAEVVLKRIMEEARTLVGAEVASVFLLDRKRGELCSTVNSTGGELRIPLKSGVAGFVASTGMPLIIQNAYGDERFNTEVDHKTGFKTRNILCVPIRARRTIIGVAQLINKTPGGVLTPPEAGLVFTLDDQKFFEVFASQAGAALAPQDTEMLLGSPLACAAGTTGPSGSAPSAASEPAPRVAAPPSPPEGEEPEEPKVVKAKTCPAGSAARAAAAMRASSMNPAALLALAPLLEDAWGSWGIDTLSLGEVSGNTPLSSLAFFLIQRHGLVDMFNIDESKLKAFLRKVEAGYPDSNEYHNRAHAASVVHFLHMLLARGGVLELVQGGFEAWEPEPARRRGLVMLACLLAAVVHDYEHEGVSNDFLVKTHSERALTYNDRSPNEQHHVAAAWRLLIQPEFNFLPTWNPMELRSLRRVMVDLVLATDMAEHGRTLDRFREVLPDDEAAAGAKISSQSDAVVCLQIALKCADLGHLALPWCQHLRWVHRLESEFYKQGDREQELEFEALSFLMDRRKPGVTQTQVGFFDFLVLPLFRTMVKGFPQAAHMANEVEENYRRWRRVEGEVAASNA